VRFIPGRNGRLRRRFVLLAPRFSHPNCFSDSTVDGALHQRLLVETQKLRGQIALEESAIEPWQLSSDGRHVQPADDNSWHLLTLDEHGHVAACTRYLPHPNTVSFHELTVSRSALATSANWGKEFRQAIEADLALARKRRWSYVEMGGWVISEKLRCTTEAVRMVLTAYGLAQLFGGALGISTVTTRRGSSSILRRIGGESVLSRGIEMPSYYEPQHKCEMEILRFDSSRPNPRYRPWVDDCRSYIEKAPVIFAKAGERSLEQIRVAIQGRFQHNGQSASAESASPERVWEQSTGVA
jgi:hypothetical protein